MCPWSSITCEVITPEKLGEEEENEKFRSPCSDLVARGEGGRDRESRLGRSRWQKIGRLERHRWFSLVKQKPTEWTTATRQIAGRKSPWKSVRGGKAGTNAGHLRGWRGSDQGRRVCASGVVKDPERERGVHPGLGRWGVEDLQNHSEGGDGQATAGHSKRRHQKRSSDDCRKSGERCAQIRIGRGDCGTGRIAES